MLSFLPLSAALPEELVDRVEAIVNKRAIYRSDLERFRELIPLRAKIDPLFGTSSLARKPRPTNEEILPFLIDEAIISDRFPATEADVDQEINTIQGNMKISRDAFRSAITREGFRFEDYFGLMRVAISKRQLLEREIRNKAVVSEDDLRAEYNRERSGTKGFSGSFHLYLIRISKGRYKSPALAKEAAQHALDALRKGESFESVAKRVSDDPTAESGGELGYLAYSEMSPLLQTEVRKLGPEKTSGLIEDSKDLLVLRVADIRSGDDAGFSKEKEVLRARLLETEFQHQVELWLTRERAGNFVKISGGKS